MLNEKEILKAIELQREGKTIREISETLNTNRSEINYTVNAYKIIDQIYAKKHEALKNKVTVLDNGTEIYTSQIQEKEKELQEWEQKLLEREAWIRLFTKNIIYKYRVKNQNLTKKYEKFIQIKQEEMKALKEEHFAATFNLQKEIKEKLDTLQEFDNYKYLNIYKYTILFLLGIVSGILFTIIANYIKGFYG